MAVIWRQALLASALGLVAAPRAPAEAASASAEARLQAQFQAAGASLLEALGCRERQDEACATHAEQAHHEHQRRFLELRKALEIATAAEPANLLTRSPFVPDAIAVLSPRVPPPLPAAGWDLYATHRAGLPSESHGWGMYAQSPEKRDPSTPTAVREALRVYQAGEALAAPSAPASKPDLQSSNPTASRDALDHE